MGLIIVSDYLTKTLALAAFQDRLFYNHHTINLSVVRTRHLYLGVSMQATV
jgi:hypothetical protein